MKAIAVKTMIGSNVISVLLESTGDYSCENRASLSPCGHWPLEGKRQTKRRVALHVVDAHDGGVRQG